MNLDRRGFLAACSRAGVTSALLPGILYTLAVQAQEAPNTDQSKPPKITAEMIDQAAVLAGIGPFSAEQKQMMIDGLVDNNGSCKAIRKLNIPNSVAPAFVFHPLPAAGVAATKPRNKSKKEASEWKPDTTLGVPRRIEDLAFATVSELASLLHTNKVTSVALTVMYLCLLYTSDAA